MPKKRKSRLKTLPNRQCKKPKLDFTRREVLREKKKSINYDDDKSDSLKFYESDDLSDHIELSSGDSKEKKDCEENDTLDSECSSVVITSLSYMSKTKKDGLKPTFFESITHEITFEDKNINEITNEDETDAVDKNVENKDPIENKVEDEKSTLKNCFGSAISLSSSETKSNVSVDPNQEKHKKVHAALSSTGTESDEIFYVEKIVDMKIENGKKLFLLKWEGFSDSENTWEPEENIQTKDMVQEFLLNWENKEAQSRENENNQDQEKIENNISNNESDEEVTILRNECDENENIVINEIENSTESTNNEKVIPAESENCEHIVNDNKDDIQNNTDNNDHASIDDVHIQNSIPISLTSESLNGNNDGEGSALKLTDCPPESNIIKPVKIHKISKKKTKKSKKKKKFKLNSDESENNSVKLKSLTTEIINNDDNVQINENEDKITSSDNKNKSMESSIANRSGNESDCSVESVRSSKKTESKNSKDPNSFFPENMPQNVQEIFMVEKILKMRVCNGVRRFFLKWEGFPDSENTWEPEENLECPELIKEFLQRQKKLKKLKKRKSISTDDSLVLEELPEEVLIKEPPVKPRGFPRSREPEAILSAGIIKDQLMFLIKWKNIDSANLVSARRANVECPQLVIRFHEDHLCWRNSDNTITPMPLEKIDTLVEEKVNKTNTNIINDTSNNPELPISPRIGLKSPNKNHPLPIKPKVKSKSFTSPKTLSVPPIRLKSKGLKTYRNIEKKLISQTNELKPTTGTSSESMMNLIKNFKNRKVVDQPKPPIQTIKEKPEQISTVDDDFVSSRHYESRDIPKELTPPKIELPKPTQVPVLRTINDYRAELPRKTPLNNNMRPVPSAPLINMPQANSIQSFYSNNINPLNAVTHDTTQLIGVQQIGSMPNLTPAPNPSMSITNPSLNNQISSFNALGLNNFIVMGNNQQPTMSPAVNPQHITNSSTDPLNNSLHSSNPVTNNLLIESNNSLLRNYLNVPTMSLNSYTQIPNISMNNQNSLTNKNFHNSLNQIRNPGPIDPQITNNNGNVISGSNPSETMSTYLPICPNSQLALTNKNASRMQLAAVLHSRYQQNKMVVMHPNIIPQSLNLNNPVVIYQNHQVQHSQPPYQQYNTANANPQNFNSIPTVPLQQQQQQQQQPYYTQQPLSLSPINNNPCFILPKMDNFPIQSGDLNQHLLQQTQNQYQQHSKEPSSELLQNSYLNLRAFL